VEIRDGGGRSREALERMIDRDLVERLFRQMPITWLGHILLAGLLVIGLHGRVVDAWLYVWFSLICLALGYRYYLTVRFWQVHLQRREPRQWGRAVTLTSLLEGLGWGLAALLFVPGDEPFNLLVVFALLLVLSLLAVGGNGYWMRGYFAFTLPATGLLVLRLFQLGGFEHLVLGSAVILYDLVTGAVAWDTSRSLRESLRLRYENLDLVEELNRADDSKTRFLAAASHDLRQPVHAFTLFVESLDPEVRSERGRELLGHIREAIGAHGNLLNSLLDISRLDAGVVEPSLEPVALGSLFELLQRELAADAEAKGLRLRVRPASGWVVSDAGLLANILRNLLTNAIRYTERGGVLLACRGRGERVVIEVWDSGVGIPPEAQTRVFEEFSQLHNPERDRAKGLGLGLAIVLRLCRLLGHSLALYSRPGRGTLMRLTLERSKMVPRVKSAGGVRRRRDGLNGVRVLVIDDEALVRKGMESMLGGWGLQVSLADSLEAAVREALAADPQLLIADYRLRDHTTGVEAIRAVEAALGHRLPALLVSGDTAIEGLNEVAQGGYPLLHKPVPPAQLRVVLGELLRVSP